MNDTVKLAVEDLHLSYGTLDVLKGISLQLKQGEVVALLGPSGSGKTTLLRAIAGLERPKAGRVTMGEKVVYDAARSVDLPVEKRGFGMVFQSYALWPHRTVYENVAYGLKLRSETRDKTREAVRTVLGQLGLSGYEERYPHQLSGGQQQRVAIARTLVYSPPVILMDEPLSNLDANLREEAKTWLRSIITEMNLSAIIVTHDQHEAMAIGDKVILLADGRIQQSGQPVEIYNNPATWLTASFFGRNNRLNGKVVDASGSRILVEGGFGRIVGTACERLSVGDDCSVVIRAERVSILPDEAEHAIACEHVTSMYSGPHWQHAFRRGEHIFTAYGPDPLTRSSYWLSAPAEHVWAFRAAAA